MKERHDPLIFMFICFICTLFILGLAAANLIDKARRGWSTAPRIEKAVPVPVERPAARFGEREASSFALRASEDFT